MNRFNQVILKNLPRIVVYWPRMKHMALCPQRYTGAQRYDMAMKCVRHVARMGGIEVEAFGLEHIPPEGGCLVCPNHQDKFDPLAIWLTHAQPISVVIDDAACHRPIIRDFARIIDAVKLEKTDMKSMYRMTEEVTRHLKSGGRFILFPERQYEEDYHTLRPFMAGCFRSAIRSGTPILPVAIIDSFHAFAENRPAPVRVGVHYLEPIRPEEYEGLRTKEVSDLVRSRIQAALDCYQH